MLRQNAAASKRAQADQVEELADVEKQNVNLSGRTMPENTS
jgi:hypothetical protein